MSSECCYFILFSRQPEDVLKIGRTTALTMRLAAYRQDLRKSEIMTGLKTDMSLLGVIPGGADLESELLSKCAAWRLDGEYHRYSGGMKQFVAALGLMKPSHKVAPEGEGLPGFASRLSWAVRESELSLSKLARTISAPKSTLSDWTNSDCLPRDIKAVHRLSKLLGVNFEWLLFGDAA